MFLCTHFVKGFNSHSNILESSSLPESELLLSFGEDFILCTGDIAGTSPASAKISLGDTSFTSNHDNSVYSLVNWSKKSEKN